MKKILVALVLFVVLSVSAGAYTKWINDPKLLGWLTCVIQEDCGLGAGVQAEKVCFCTTKEEVEQVIRRSLDECLHMTCTGRPTDYGWIVIFMHDYVSGTEDAFIMYENDNYLCNIY